MYPDACLAGAATAKMMPRTGGGMQLAVHAAPCVSETAPLFAKLLDRRYWLAMVFGEPYPVGASRPRKTLRLIEIIPLNARRSRMRGLSSLLRTNGLSRAIYPLASWKRLLFGPSFCAGAITPQACDQRIPTLSIVRKNYGSNQRQLTAVPARQRLRIRING